MVSDFQAVADQTFPGMSPDGFLSKLFLVPAFYVSRQKDVLVSQLHLNGAGDSADSYLHQLECLMLGVHSQAD